MPCKSRSVAGFSLRWVIYLGTPHYSAFTRCRVSVFRLPDQLQASVRLDFLSSDNKLNLLSVYQQQGPPGPCNQRKLQTISKQKGKMVFYDIVCFLLLRKSLLLAARKTYSLSLVPRMINQQGWVALQSSKTLGPQFTFKSQLLQCELCFVLMTPSA